MTTVMCAEGWNEIHISNFHYIKLLVVCDAWRSCDDSEALSFTQQESPAIADKPARRESMPKIAPILRAYNIVADNIGLASCV